MGSDEGPVCWADNCEIAMYFVTYVCSQSKLFLSRRYVRVGVVNGIVYAVGGYDGSAHLNTVECFDPMTNAWRAVASMASRRSSAGVAVLNDMLYVVGKWCRLVS